MSNTKFKYDVGVVGLGYVGLPLAVEAASSGLKVIGYDINSERVEMINNGNSPIEDISNEELSKSLVDFHSTTESKELSQCKNIVISVPTPLTDYQPDLSFVVNAAKTKPFGFESFKPGPGVGGHCIPVDPEYLSFKTRQIGKPVRFVELAQEINNSMPGYVVTKVNEILNSNEIILNNSKILLMGVAYKKDISDMRESPAIDIAELLLEKNVNVSYFDPHVEEFKVSGHIINKEIDTKLFDNYDMLLVITPHTQFAEINFSNYQTIIFDTTGSDFIKSTERI